MTDRIQMIREKALDEAQARADSKGIREGIIREGHVNTFANGASFGADLALTYTDEDVERAARQMVQDNTINWPEWDRLPEDTQEFWKRIATTTFESFGARRAE